MSGGPHPLIARLEALHDRCRAEAAAEEDAMHRATAPHVRAQAANAWRYRRGMAHGFSQALNEARTALAAVEDPS